MDIEKIESEENVTFAIKPDTGAVACRGEAEVVKRAIDRLAEDPEEALRLLRVRQGLPEKQIVEREVSLMWNPTYEVSKQRRFAAQYGIYHQWTEAEYERLHDFLKPGDVVEPTYAHSLYIKHPDGSETHYRKDGKILA